MVVSIDRRIGFLFAGFLILLALAGARATWLATVKSGKLQTAARSQQVADNTVPARRGTIVDRHGVELAVSEPASDVSATPYLVKDPVAAARKLSPILDRSESDIVKLLAQRDTGFVYLPRQLPADQAQQIADLHLTGIDEMPTTRRTYPRQWLASQVLGTVGTDGKGLSGLEYSYNRALHGTDGERKTTSDALGQPIELRDVKPALPGAKLDLTLDSALQGKAEAVLGQVGATFKPSAQPRSSWTRGPASCWPWPTGRAWTPTTSPAPPTGRATTWRR